MDIPGHLEGAHVDTLGAFFAAWPERDKVYEHFREMGEEMVSYIPPQDSVAYSNANRLIDAVQFLPPDVGITLLYRMHATVCTLEEGRRTEAPRRTELGEMSMRRLADTAFRALVPHSPTSLTGPDRPDNELN